MFNLHLREEQDKCAALSSTAASPDVIWLRELQHLYLCKSARPIQYGEHPRCSCHASADMQSCMILHMEGVRLVSARKWMAVLTCR